MPTLSGRHRRNSVIFARRVALVILVIFCFPVYLAASEKVADCTKLDSIESVETLRKCYQSRVNREASLRRAIQLSDDLESKIREAEFFVQQIAPLSTQARVQLLDLYLEASFLDSALRELRAIEKLDRNYFSEEIKARYLVQIGQHKEARKILEKILDSNPANIQARKLSAVTAYELGKYSEAVQDLQFLSNPNSPSPPIELALAKTLYKNGEKKRAAERLEFFSRANFTKDPALSFELGEVAEMIGNLELAENAYRSSLIVSFRPERTVSLARLLVRRGRSDGAAEVLKAAIASHPKNDKLLSALASLYSETGSISALGSFLEELAEKYPEKKWAAEKLVSARKLFGGKEMVIPVAAARGEVARKRKPAAAELDFIRVKNGDTLMGLSYKIFGTHQKWKKLLEMNRDRLSSSDGLRPGMRLVVPKPPKGVDQE